MIRVPDRRVAAPGLLQDRPAPGTIRAAQAAKSGAGSGQKQKGQVSIEASAEMYSITAVSTSMD